MPGQRGHPHMIVPPGHRAVCPTCTGAGGFLRERATLTTGPRMATGVVREPCRPCEGTGWIPPKHQPETAEDEGD